MYGNNVMRKTGEDGSISLRAYIPSCYSIGLTEQKETHKPWKYPSRDCSSDPQSTKV
jgi:hypothetical protein